MKVNPNSSNIQEFSYLEATNILAVKFKSGKNYLYYGVPIQLFNEMRNASSAGSFLNQKIKGSFGFTQADDDEYNDMVSELPEVMRYRINYDKLAPNIKTAVNI